MNDLFIREKTLAGWNLLQRDTNAMIPKRSRGRLQTNWHGEEEEGRGVVEKGARERKSKTHPRRGPRSSTSRAIRSLHIRQRGWSTSDGKRSGKKGGRLDVRREGIGFQDSAHVLSSHDTTRFTPSSSESDAYHDALLGEKDKEGRSDLIAPLAAHAPAPRSTSPVPLDFRETLVGGLGSSAVDAMVRAHHVSTSTPHAREKDAIEMGTGFGGGEGDIWGQVEGVSFVGSKATSPTMEWRLPTPPSPTFTSKSIALPSSPLSAHPTTSTIPSTPLLTPPPLYPHPYTPHLPLPASTPAPTPLPIPLPLSLPPHSTPKPLPPRPPLPPPPVLPRHSKTWARVAARTSAGNDGLVVSRRTSSPSTSTPLPRRSHRHYPPSIPPTTSTAFAASFGKKLGHSKPSLAAISSKPNPTLPKTTTTAESIAEHLRLATKAIAEFKASWEARVVGGDGEGGRDADPLSITTPPPPPPLPRALLHEMHSILSDLAHVTFFDATHVHKGAAAEILGDLRGRAHQEVHSTFDEVRLRLYRAGVVESLVELLPLLPTEGGQAVVENCIQCVTNIFRHRGVKKEVLQGVASREQLVEALLLRLEQDGPSDENVVIKIMRVMKTVLWDEPDAPHSLALREAMARSTFVAQVARMIPIHCHKTFVTVRLLDSLSRFVLCAAKDTTHDGIQQVTDTPHLVPAIQTATRLASRASKGERKTLQEASTILLSILQQEEDDKEEGGGGGGGGEGRRG